LLRRSRDGDSEKVTIPLTNLVTSDPGSTRSGSAGFCIRRSERAGPRVGPFTRHKPSPGFHKRSAPFKQVRASIGPFNAVTDDVRQCSLRHLSICMGAFTTPISECGTKPVGCQPSPFHSLHKGSEDSIRHWPRLAVPSLARARENELNIQTFHALEN